jgi:Uri superfamily endonuclease
MGANKGVSTTCNTKKFGRFLKREKPHWHIDSTANKAF